MSNKEFVDDEIDLRELFKLLWNGKRLISVLVVSFLAVGLVYLSTAKPMFRVSVLYQINVYPFFEQQFCASTSNSHCLTTGATNTVLKMLNAIQTVNLEEKGWELNGKDKTFEFETETPLSIEKYLSYFDSIAAKATETIKSQAQLELAMIENEFSELLQSTERVATNILNAKRTVHIINNGTRAVEFSTPLIEKTSKWSLLLVLCALLGTMIGVTIVLLRHAFSQHDVQTVT